MLESRLIIAKSFVSFWGILIKLGALHCNFSILCTLFHFTQMVRFRQFLYNHYKNICNYLKHAQLKIRNKASHDILTQQRGFLLKKSTF